MQLTTKQTKIERRPWNHGLVSLWDMLRINAYHYIQAAELLGEIKKKIDDSWLVSSAPITVEAIGWIKGTLPNLATHCVVLRLDVTNKHIDDFLSGWTVFAGPVPMDAPLTRRRRYRPLKLLHPPENLLTVPPRNVAAFAIRCIASSFK